MQQLIDGWAKGGKIIFVNPSNAANRGGGFVNGEDRFDCVGVVHRRTFAPWRKEPRQGRARCEPGLFTGQARRGVTGL